MAYHRGHTPRITNNGTFFKEFIFGVSDAIAMVWS